MLRGLRTIATSCALLLGPVSSSAIALQATGANVSPAPLFPPNVATDLFRALDLSRSELASVRAALQQNNSALAEHTLAQYYRQRSSVGWKTDTLPHASPQNQAIADQALQGKLEGGMVPLFYTFPANKIDWHFNATYHTLGQSPNDEWQWQLNRMSFWTDLALVYRSTRDERYAKAFAEEMRSWIVQCPPPFSLQNVAGSSWRTIEAGIRMGNPWIDAFYAFRTSPELSDQDLLAFVHSFLEHGRFLSTHHTATNWLTIEMSGLYAVAAEFPEFKESAAWRALSSSTLADAGQHQFLPDGGQVDLSSGYQNVALDGVVHIAQIAKWAGLDAELPATYLAPFSRPYQWQIAIVAPTMWLPKNNDSWPVYLPGVLKTAAPFFPHETEFTWFATKHQQGTPPAFTSVFLNWSGLAVMRASWATDANYLLFRVGPLGMGHQHQDSLGLNIWAYGRELVFVGTGGSYERSKWRDWAVSAYAHNTVVVDGLAQNRPIGQTDPVHDPNLVSQEPIDAHWRTNPVYDFASAVYDGGYGPQHSRVATQQRDVLYLKPDMYVVVDRIKPADAFPHRVEARWQLQTTQTQLDPSTQVLVTKDPGLPNIAVVPLLTAHLSSRAVSAQQTPELLGWDVRKDVIPQVVPATTLLQSIGGSGPQLLINLILPLQQGESSPVTRVQAGPDETSATVFFADGRKLLVACPSQLGFNVQEILPGGKQGRTAKTSTGDAQSHRRVE